MDTPRLFSGRESSMFLRLARTAFLCSLAMAGAALAAPCADDHCRDALGSMDGLSMDGLSMDGLAMTAHELDLRRVDLGDADSIEVAGTPDSVAPLLYLTPRVASILEEVFGDTAAETADAVIDEAEAPAAITDAASADEDPELYGPLSQAGNADHPPKFQRQMYRTDI